jgi:putative Mg2+ transporter-C (MgtC) family protein
MENLIIYIKLLVAILAGGMIGFQREFYHKFAGLRTHILVCAGTALLASLSFAMYGISDSTGRIIAGIITGIGFLGAGTIISSPEGYVKGLTSAATIWITGIIGIVIGVGYYFLGITAAIITVIVLLFKDTSLEIDRITKKGKQ